MLLLSSNWRTAGREGGARGGREERGEGGIGEGEGRESEILGSRTRREVP